MAKVKLALKDQTREERISQATTIKTSMTGNANFTTPNPTLTVYGTSITTAQTKLNAYNVAAAAAETALADLDASMVVMDGYTTQLGDYVQNITGGDKTKIESAGMDTRSDAAPLTMTQVLDLVLSEGDDSGTLDIVWKPIKGARSYEIWINTGNPSTEAEWSLNTTAGKSSIRLTGLTSGVKLWVRVRAIGSGNQKGAYSDPATKTVP